jgi:transposase
VGNTRRQFDPEFRAGAVRIVAETDKSVAQVARDLWISPYTLHNWVQADQRKTEQPSGALAEDEREELARLRTEQARWAKDKAELEMERDDAPMLVKPLPARCADSAPAR